MSGKHSVIVNKKRGQKTPKCNTELTLVTSCNEKLKERLGHAIYYLDDLCDNLEMYLGDPDESGDEFPASYWWSKSLIKEIKKEMEEK